MKVFAGTCGSWLAGQSNCGEGLGGRWYPEIEAALSAGPVKPPLPHAVH